MKSICRVLALVGMMILGSTVARAEKEKEIAISQVPQTVIAAAEKAVPGIKLTEAEVQKTEKGLVYEVEGSVDGQEYEITISESGEVLKVVQENDAD
jgi:uncharacterized membrane protein YkoI